MTVSADVQAELDAIEAVIDTEIDAYVAEKVTAAETAAEAQRQEDLTALQGSVDKLKAKLAAPGGGTAGAATGAGSAAPATGAALDGGAASLSAEVAAVPTGPAGPQPQPFVPAGLDSNGMPQT